MKKNDIVQELASRCDIPEEKAAQVLATLFEAEKGEGIIARAIDSGTRLTVPGFGTFGVKMREARSGKAPGDAQSTVTVGKRYAYFKPARPLRDRVATGPHVDEEDAS